MSGDLPDRLRALPPELPDVADRVQRVRQLARHRRRVQIGAVAAGTAIAVVVPVVLTSALAGQHAAVDRRPAQPGPTAEFATACAFSGLTSRPVQPQKLTRTRDEVLAVVPKGDAVSVFPALVTDPTAPKVGLGSATKARPMWMAYVLSKVARFNGGGAISRGGPPIGAQAPGMRGLALTLIDDATLKFGGNFSCRPVSAASDNRGFGIPDNTRVTVSGPILQQYGGYLICRGGAIADVGPFNYSGPYCTDQVALHGDKHLLARNTSTQERTVTGTWEHNAITVDSISAQKAPTYHVPTTPPCPQPAAGWASVPPSKTPGLDQAALHHY